MSGGIAALLFTDASGNVVFVDDGFLRLFGYLEFGEVLGEPLHGIMHMSHHDAQEMLHEASQNGTLAGRWLHLKDLRGQAFELFCSGVATYDERGGFLGVDLTLLDAVDDLAGDQAPRHHYDVLHQHVDRVYQSTYSTVSEHSDPDALLLNLYLKAHIDALGVLLSRLAGYRVRGTMEGIFNSRAERQSWPVRLRGSELTFTGSTMPREAYHDLLNTLIQYASGVVGRRQACSELAAVHDHAAERVRALVDALDIPRLFAS